MADTQGKSMKIRTYSELVKFKSFEERYRYLKLEGIVGVSTFGFDRYLNQAFYRSPEWKSARRLALIRDDGLDLAMRGYEINGPVLIHHMNPISQDDIELRNPKILDVEFLICTTPATHNAIHFGDETILPKLPVERRRGDTKLW